LFCKATTRTLSGHYCYVKDQQSFSVPDDVTDYENYRMMTSSRLRNDEIMTMDVYSLGKDSLLASALVVSESSFHLSYENVCVVGKKTIGINEDDEVVYFLETYSGETKEQTYVYKENYNLIDNLDTGDIIRISKNTNGEVESVIKVYDYDKKEWNYSTDGTTLSPNPTASYNDNVTVRVLLSQAYKVSDGYVGLVKYDSDLSEVSDADIEAYKFSELWYIYDVVKHNNINVRRAKFEDIVEAKYNQQGGSFVVIQTEYNQTKIAYIIN